MAAGTVMVGSGAGDMPRETVRAAPRLAASLLPGIGRWLAYVRYLGWPRK